VLVALYAKYTHGWRFSKLTWNFEQSSETRKGF
jgi:hypothetical protein